MSDGERLADDENVGRRLPLAGWAAVVIAYLVVLKVGGLLVGPDVSGVDEVQTDEQVLRTFVIPIGTSLLFAIGVTTWLGWWRPVLVERRRVQRWVLVVPVLFLLAIVAGTNYGELADRSGSFVVLLLLGMLFVGFAEELMFRGLGVHVLRQHGMTEGRVALWSSVVFGLAHITNAIDTGGAAVGQAIAVSFAGYFFYLTRRAAGTLLVGAVVHGLFDFSITTTEIGGENYAGAVAALLIYPALGAIVLLRRRHIELRRAPSAAPDGNTVTT